MDFSRPSRKSRNLKALADSDGNRNGGKIGISPENERDRSTTVDSRYRSLEKNYEERIRDELKLIDLKRQTLEAESSAIIEELLQTPLEGGQPMGIDTPLVDQDGYPRADIDLYRARNLRKRLAEIKTDLKAIMIHTEKELQRLFIAQKPDTANEINEEMNARTAKKPPPKFDPITQKWVVRNWDGSVSGIENGHNRSFDRLEEILNSTPINTVLVDPNPSRESLQTTHPVGATAITAPPLDLSIPFAVVDDVSPHSPAEDAGLQIGDLIVHFGPVNYHNHRNLAAIAEIIPDAAVRGQELTISILRRRRMSVDHDVTHSVEAGIRIKKEIKILPRSWNGRGFLGCHIKAYSDATDYEEP